MSLYPSLEDMKVDHMAKAQISQSQPAILEASAPSFSPKHEYGAPQPAYGAAAQPAYGAVYSVDSMSHLYPSLQEYMGLSITPEILDHHGLNEVVEYQPPEVGGMVAPITGTNNLALKRAEIKQGLRQVIACKGEDGKIGLRVQHINKGVFISLVQKDSPAALAGLRFGDQILQINGTDVAGFDKDKTMKMLKKADGVRIEFVIRDRPFERTITLQKDSVGHVGFIFKNGKITSIAKDSSASRNGLLTEHNLIEICGQNVVGLKDKEINQIIENCDRTVVLTILPTFIYDHMVKCMADSLMKKTMDHSIPEI